MRLDCPIVVALGKKNMDAVIRYRRIQLFGCALPQKAYHPSGQFVISAWSCVPSHLLPTHLSNVSQILSDVDTADALSHRFDQFSPHFGARHRQIVSKHVPTRPLAPHDRMSWSQVDQQYGDMPRSLPGCQLLSGWPNSKRLCCARAPCFAFDVNNDDKSSAPQSERTAGSDVRTQRGASDLKANNGGSHECDGSTLDLRDSGNLYPTGIGLLALLHVAPHAFGRRPEATTPGSVVFVKNQQAPRDEAARQHCCQTAIATRKHRLGRDKVSLQKPHLGGLLAVSKVRATCETFVDPCASPVPDDLAPADSEGHKDMFIGAHPRERARQVWRSSRA